METLKFKLLCFAMLFASLVAQTKAQKSLSLTENGKFVIGCNYWASHVGYNMWKDWRPDVVDADLKQIADAGMQVIRIFPIWPDFQPIFQHYSGEGTPYEIRFKDGPLSATGPGKDGVSVEALAHFKEFADLAQKHNIKLIVGLVTGWMGGKLFVPNALEGHNIITDPLALKWQVRYVSTFVRELKGHPAILAWDLGNECNVMGKVESSEAAYTWTAIISKTIRTEDSSLPVVSGMHSLTSANNAHWKIQDQAELTDVLTTHPYPIFTPYANLEPYNTIRTIMHSVAETRFYGDIGGKPAMVEEVGTVGPMDASENIKSNFLRSILFNNWANNCHGTLWWCAYDFEKLNFPAYEWYDVERDLGIFRSDRSPKPFVKEFRAFRNFLDNLPFDKLPERRKEAVCVLTEGQDQWGCAYASYILAKQAGFDIEFQQSNQPIKDAQLYILPSLNGLKLMNRTEWLVILDKVMNGASLYVSMDYSFLSHFIDAAGIIVESNHGRSEPASIVPVNKNFKPFKLSASRQLIITPTTATVLASEKDGNPVFTVNNYGNGKIYFFSMPLEMTMIKTPRSFDSNTTESWRVYETIARDIIQKNRTVTRNDPFVGITEHDLSDNEKVLVMVNYATTDKQVPVTIKAGWHLEKVIYGQGPQNAKVAMKGNDACVFTIKNN